MVHNIFGIIFRFTRPRRMRRFAQAIQLGDETILDVGGTPAYWSYLEARSRIILLNRRSASVPAPRFTVVQADGCALPFADRSVPIVFSNSVIEHVGDDAAQSAFAAELRRVGNKLWVQTPAWIFPVEPHFIGLFVHWLPVAWRKRVVRWATVWGWVSRVTQEQADSLVDEIRLLTYADMQRLFPDCEILVERFCFWPKAYIAVRR